MSQVYIQDYLHTQGLKLPLEEVQIAYATLGAVFNLAEVKDLPENLWQAQGHGFDATAFLDESADNNAFLRAVYAVLDTTMHRFPAKVALYMTAERQAVEFDVEAIEAAEAEPVILQRLWHNQFTLPASLNHEQHGHLLAHRAAQTGWAYVVEDAQHWLRIQELTEDECRLGFSQLLLPLCAPSGAVLGLLYVSSPEAHAFDASAQAWWVAACLTLADALYHHFPTAWWGQQDENNDDLPTGN